MSTSKRGFLAPNTTQTPDALFALMPLMTDTELRVTLYLIRQTFGWRREWSDPKHSTTPVIAKRTGLTQRGVRLGVTAGMNRGTIEREPAPETRSYSYRVAISDADEGSHQVRVTSCEGHAGLPTCSTSSEGQGSHVVGVAIKEELTPTLTPTEHPPSLPNLTGGDGALLDADGPPPPADADAGDMVAEVADPSPDEYGQPGRSPLVDEPSPVAPADLTVDEIDQARLIRASLAAWLGYDLRTISPETHHSMRTWIVQYLRSGGTYADFQTARRRWSREHHAGRDRSKTPADRRPASIRQATDWVARCRATEPDVHYASDDEPGESAPLLAAGAGPETHRPPLALQPALAPEPAAALADADDLAAVWAEVREHLRLTVVARTFDAWFAGARLVRIEPGADGDVAVIAAPTDEAAAWLVERAKDRLIEAVQSQRPDVMAVLVVPERDVAAAERQVA